MRVLRFWRDLAASVLLVTLAACSGGSSDITLEPLTTTTTKTEPPTTESPGTTSTTERDLEPDVKGPWVSATGNLAGLPSECGNLQYVSVRPDRDMLIASVALQGLWASENGSETWAKLGQGPGSDDIINRGTAIVYEPAKPNTFWESGIYNGGGVYRTDDNGRTFRQLGDVRHADSISVDLTDPDRQTLLTGIHEQTRVHRSTDGGATWTDISATLPPNIGVTSTPVAQTASTYLLGTNNGAMSGIFRTTDAGATWTQVFKGGVKGLPLEAKADDSIYWVLAQSGGVVKSTDGGATWSQVAPDGTVNPSAPSIVELPDGRLAAAGRTVVISSDGGKSWRAVGPGMPITPAGFSYSPFRKAFYIWYFSCATGAPNPVMADAIMRLDFDHTDAMTLAQSSPQTDTVEIEYVGFLLGHGGDALQMLALANGMHEHGTRVHITVPSIPSSVTFAERCDALGIECDRSPLLAASMDGTNQSLPKILRLLRSIKAPVVHFHTGNSCLPRTVMLALEVLRNRTSMVTIQSPYETIVPGSQRGRFWAATARRRMSAVVSPSRHASEFQVRCGVPASLALTVHNSVDIDAVSHGDGRGPRAALGIGPSDPVVLFCSRLDSQKRPLEAVQIFDGVAREFPSAVLVFVGQGSEQGAVEAEAERLGISERVCLVGYQTDVPNWLAAATVWLLPTERENFSLAVLEGLAAGCAVLSTTCRGNDEVLVDHQNALTFPVGDVAGATTALGELLRDLELRVTLSRNGRATADRYSVANMVDGYQIIYDRIGAGPHGSGAS